MRIIVKLIMIGPVTNCSCFNGIIEIESILAKKFEIALVRKLIGKEEKRTGSRKEV